VTTFEYLGGWQLGLSGGNKMIEERVNEYIRLIDEDVQDILDKESSVYGVIDLAKAAPDLGFEDIAEQLPGSAWVPLKSDQYSCGISANATDCGALAKLESGLIVYEDAVKLAGMEAGKDYTPFRFPSEITLKFC